MKLLAVGPVSMLPMIAGLENFMRSGSDAFQFSMILGSEPGRNVYWRSS